MSDTSCTLCLCPNRKMLSLNSYIMTKVLEKGEENIQSFSSSQLTFCHRPVSAVISLSKEVACHICS